MSFQGVHIEIERPGAGSTKGSTFEGVGSGAWELEAPGLELAVAFKRV